MENFGGAAALIADNVRGEDVEEVVMTDHGGAGHSLVTPGLMIDYSSGESIKKACKNGELVIMRASLTIAKPDNEIEIGLLYSSSLDLDALSMQAFTSMALESA